jgi:3-oxoacyl-[acyl-carrier protein] reductase
MELGLRGKKALITGASRGIGRSCAEVLAQEGCDVVIVSRTQADLDAAQAGILAASNVSVRSYAMDLSDSRNTDRLAAECADTDILINNAGAIPRGAIAEIDEARWREAWDLKVFGYINMTRRFYALMAARRSGVIVNIIGSAGEAVQSSYACGSAGNASLMGFTRALGGTAPNDGLRVVGINPGPVETDRMVTRLRREATAKFGDPERWRELTSHMAFGRAATATEIANMTAFLASDRSSYTTGTIVTVDGGGTGRGGPL